MGWVTVAAYLVATLLCWAAFRRTSGRQSLFWSALAVMLFLLAINKQLDLQSALTAAGRCMAQAQGWYDQRQTVQLAFIAGIAALCLGLACFAVWFWQQDVAEIWLALVGFAVLLAFVAIRAAGFHHIDRFIGFELGNVRVNWVLELGGITAIAVNAAARRHFARHRNKNQA